MTITPMINRLNPLETAQLLEIYNAVSERKITRFSDRTTALKRVEVALNAANKDFTYQRGVLTIADRVEGQAAKDSRKITRVGPNPKREKTASHARYELYKVGMTIAEYIAAAAKTGVDRHKAVKDLRWDTAHGNIEIEK